MDGIFRTKKFKYDEGLGKVQVCLKFSLSTDIRCHSLVDSKNKSSRPNPGFSKVNLFKNR